MRDKSDLYYECHVTMDPPKSTECRSIIEAIAKTHGFKMSEFAMLPGGDRDPMAFASARDESYSLICLRAKNFTDGLKLQGFHILRVKVEDTLLYTKKQGDVWGFLC